MMYDGIAIISPVEVVIRASETPSAITDEGPADEAGEADSGRAGGEGRGGEVDEAVADASLAARRITDR